MVDQMFRLTRDSWITETIKIIAKELNITLNDTNNKELNNKIIETEDLNKKLKIIENEQLKQSKLLPLLKKLETRKKAIEDGSNYPQTKNDELINFQKITKELEEFKNILDEFPNKLKNKLPKLKTPAVLIVKSTSKSEKYQLFKLIERANILRKYGIHIPIILGEGPVENSDIEKTKKI